MWKDSPEVVSLRKGETGNVDVVVRFVNVGFPDRLVGFGCPSEDELKSLILAQAKIWDSADAHSVKLGAIDVSVPIVPPVDPPTQEELDRRAFLLAYGRLSRIKRGVDIGVLASDDKLFTEALAAAIFTFKAEYEALL